MYTWFAFCASTSGVEQAFTKAQTAINDRQDSATDTFEWVLAKLATDVAHHSKDELCKGAQRVWSQCFGIPRASGAAKRVVS